MSAITWSEALALQQPRMDQTHREFVELLASLEDAVAAGPEAVDRCLAELLTHTEAHFAQEERWMADIGFAAENCHAFQHANVLKVLGELRPQHTNLELMRQLVDELGAWFVVHAQMMDAALAQTMAERGYDPETGTVRERLAEAMTGCGGSHCSH